MVLLIVTCQRVFADTSYSAHFSFKNPTNVRTFAVKSRVAVSAGIGVGSLCQPASIGFRLPAATSSRTKYVGQQRDAQPCRRHLADHAGAVCAVAAFRLHSGAFIAVLQRPCRAVCAEAQAFVRCQIGGRLRFAAFGEIAWCGIQAA